MPHDDSTCPHPDCSRPVPELIWACPEHWQTLPPRIRQAIWWARHERSALGLEAAEQHALAGWQARGDAPPFEERLAA
jgi:hypothetical protein